MVTVTPAENGYKERPNDTEQPGKSDNQIVQPAPPPMESQQLSQIPGRAHGIRMKKCCFKTCRINLGSISWEYNQEAPRKNTDVGLKPPLIPDLLFAVLATLDPVIKDQLFPLIEGIKGACVIRRLLFAALATLNLLIRE